MMQPEYPIYVALNRSTEMILMCLQDAEDVFELLHSDGQREVFGLFDNAGRPVKLVKHHPNESLTISFDASPPSSSQWITSQTIEL